jgi:NAD(P)-dependent dehydrogenase (short-subunit alcohol dehydrogenase family)
MDNIGGRTIAITSAARGIGFATAKALLARGARVVIGDRDVALQESAVAQLTNLGSAWGSSRGRTRTRVGLAHPRLSALGQRSLFEVPGYERQSRRRRQCQ